MYKLILVPTLVLPVLWLALPPRNLWSIHFIFMSKPARDSFDGIVFGSLTGSGVSLEDVQSLANSVRSERLPDVKWAKDEGCFRIQYQDTVIFICGTASTAWKIINMVILDML
jgi:hypothetical protein